MCLVCSLLENKAHCCRYNKIISMFVFLFLFLLSSLLVNQQKTHKNTRFIGLKTMLFILNT